MALLLLLCACEGRRGPAGPSGPQGPGGGGGTDTGEPTPTEYAVGEPVPAILTTITGVSGGSGANGEFLPGDFVSVQFSLLQADGTAWTMDELASGEALFSGPSFNYQRVLPVEDVRARVEALGTGRFAFTFADPIPSVYAAPYNNSASFGLESGELAGRNLANGTYTLGLSFAWEYRLAGRPFRRVGEATLDVLLGTGAGALTPRAVTSAANCNRCHGELQAHDGRYRTLALCLLCHTSGAEDANDPAIAGGTPRVTIDSRVLFHKLHSGRALPSVNGVSTRSNGARIYSAVPVPLRYARPDGVVRDFSDVGFPRMPNRQVPMPRDTGYDLLTPAQQQQEDATRLGPSHCATCHGDPDGAGPLVAPAQGSLINVPTRRACGACHDDVIFTLAYRSNNNSMPPQPNDTGCNQCHSTFPGDTLSPIDAHVHPLDRPGFNAGLQVGLTAVREAGTNDGDGTLDPGERVELEFTLKNGAGADLAASSLNELHVVLSGPNTNFQVLLDEAVPIALVSVDQPVLLTLPERLQLEYVGDSSIVQDVFQTARAPHRLATGVRTDVFVRTGTAGGASSLVAARARHDNFVDVLDPTGFAGEDLVVIDDGLAGAEEYLRISLVEGNRLWFSAPNLAARPPGLRHAHASGAGVAEVQVTAMTALDYALDPSTGTITEVSEFGDGNAVLVSYTSDYIVPAEYPQASNGSPELDDGNGKWTGRPLVSGTYVASLSAARDLVFRVSTTATRYRASSPAATLPFLVGDAFEAEPYRRLAENACIACHADLSYHNGTYRGIDTCLLCHGASGTEDLPRYVAAGAPATDGLSVEFRTLVHKIHRGRELQDEDQLVVGSGTTPGGFTTHSYTHFSTLPAYPGRTLECERCHGEGNSAVLLPSEREHPTQQVHPLEVWRPVCAACHDGEAVIAHIDSNTAPNGAEACSICHAPGEFEDALQAHLARREPR